MMRALLLFWCYVEATYGFFLNPDPVTVTTPVGQIRGITQTLFSKTTKEFFGIPYAEAPVGNQRFRKPVPKAHFTGTFDATNKATSQSCPAHPKESASESEDCLRLNIYVPGTASATNKVPVMIWIHGGGFVGGSSILYDGSVIASHGVIVVAINYRLAELGFLSTASGSLPGNYGLWDQHLAIKWVNQNIGAFGGDANDVTIFGESAGSSSIIYQTLYPGNRGLFHRAIAQSGSITSPWAYKDVHASSTNAAGFAHHCGCTQTAENAMVACLRALSSSAISVCVSTYSGGYTDYNYAWTAATDGDFVATDQWNMFEETPATKASLDFFKSLDLLIGVNRADGMLYLPDWDVRVGHNLITNPQLTKQQFHNNILPVFSKFGGPFTDVDSTFKESIYSFYADDDPHMMLRNLVQFTTDIGFTAPSVKALTAHEMSGTASSYFYEFAYSPGSHLLPVIPSIDDGTMANHADEIGFVFGAAEFDGNPTDFKLSDTMIKMWTNFAKSGNPNSPVSFKSAYHVMWPEYTGSHHYYLEITSNMTQSSVKQGLSDAAVKLLLSR